MAVAVGLLFASLLVIATVHAEEPGELAIVTTIGSLVAVALGIPRLLTTDREQHPGRRPNAGG